MAASTTTSGSRSHLLNRRQFLSRSFAAGAALTILPGQLARAATEAAQGPKLRVAFVGIGHRGREMVKFFVDTGRITVAALCDVDLLAPHTEEIRSLFPDVPAVQDFRQLFDRLGDRFEAVVISTPDHSHFPIAMLAMAHGKHVYVEKPLAHTFEEVELLMAMADKTGVVTQMGNQGHSGNNFYQFKAWYEAGVIRDVTKVVGFMNSPRRWHGWQIDGYPQEPVPATIDWDLWHVARPLRPFSGKLHPGNWRSWYDFGNGAFGDWGPHILDTVHRFLELGLPHTIAAERLVGPSDLIFPQASTIRFDFAARGALPPVEVFWYDGVENRPPVPEQLGPGAELNRPNGKFIFGRDLAFQGGTHSDTLRVMPEDKMRQMAPQLPRFATGFSNHFTNFVLACQGKEEPQSPFRISGPLSQVFLLGVIAQRLGGSLKFDPVAKRFTNNDRANQLLQGPPRRPGWERYYRV
jgi:predicted dehydrogenase